MSGACSGNLTLIGDETRQEVLHLQSLHRSNGWRLLQGVIYCMNEVVKCYLDALSLSLSVCLFYLFIYLFIYFLPRFTIAEKTFSVSFCKFWLFHLLCLITARWRSPSFVRFVWIFLFRNWKERHWKANRGSFSKSKLYKNKTNGFEQKQDLSISKQFIGNNGEKTANMTVQFCVI